MLRTAVASSSKSILSHLSPSCVSAAGKRAAVCGRRSYTSPSSTDKASVSVGMMPPREVKDDSEEGAALGAKLEEILLTPGQGESSEDEIESLGEVEGGRKGRNPRLGS